MISMHQLLVFLPAAALVASAPGANNILSLSHGALEGFIPTAASLCGRFFAFSLMLTAAAGGLNAAITGVPFILTVVRWIGLIYLAYIGISMWNGAVHYQGTETAGSATKAMLARREFTVAVTNPKASLLFTVFLPQFVVDGSSYFQQLMALGGIYIFIEFCAACPYAGTGALFRFSGSSSRGRFWGALAAQ